MYERKESKKLTQEQINIHKNSQINKNFYSCSFIPLCPAPNLVFSLTSKNLEIMSTVFSDIDLGNGMCWNSIAYSGEAP